MDVVCEIDENAPVPEKIPKLERSVERPSKLVPDLFDGNGRGR